MQGSSVFDSLAAKTARASTLLASLERDSSSFLSENYRVEGRLDQESRRYRFLALGHPAMPPRFSVLIGEVIHHLRTVLDHLVFFLAGEHGNPSRLAFPVCREERGFELALKRGALTGVPHAAVRIIERLQPYRTSPNPEKATLYQLHRLNVIDKHRLLLATAACVD